MSYRARSNKGSNAGGSEDGANGGVRVVVADETFEPDPSFPGRACRVCREEDNEEMVRCDKCPKWFHFTCVGVTQAIENEPWSCMGCANPNQVAVSVPKFSDESIFHRGAKKKQTAEGDGSDPQLSDLRTLKTSYPDKTLPSQGTKKTGNKPPKAKIQTSEQTAFLGQQKAKVANPPPPKDVNPPPSNRHNAQSSHTASGGLPKAAIETTAKETVAKLPERQNRRANSVTSHGSGASLAKLRLKKLEEEQVLNERRLEQERVYLKEKYELLEEIYASERGSVANSVVDRIEGWFPDAQSSHHLPQGDQPPAPHEPSLPVADPQNDAVDPAHSVADYQQTVSNTLAHLQDNRQRSEQRSIRYSQPVHRPNEREEDGCSLTRKQLAARQAVSKDLPQFSGNPEDWPLFIATFNNTTAMCGFTNDENIFRLQKSLRGRAFEAVKSRLIHPANVPGILRTLRMMFGQPEAIVHALIEKIHSLPAIRENKLETLVDFAVSVENFCATVDACGLDEYLYNASLLHQLVSKLPPTIKLNWAQYRMSLPGVDLAAFSNWIYNLAEAASTVTIPNISDTRPVRSDNRAESRGAKKGNAFINAHSESTSSKETHSSNPPSGKNPSVANDCPVCKGSCKTVKKCKRFHAIHDGPSYERSRLVA